MKKVHIYVAVLIASFVAFLGSAQAGDEVFHTEATAVSLKKAGFDHSAFVITMVGNLAADIFHQMPPVIGMPVKGPLKEETVQFHSLDLFTPQEARQYLENLELTAKEAVQKEAAKIKSRGKLSSRENKLLLLLMGVTIHAVQDFYAHSNWVEEWDGNDIPTWDEAIEITKGNDSKAQMAQSIIERIASVDHNKNNKDSPRSAAGRKYSKNGKTYYVLAEETAGRATADWVKKFKAWINDDKIWDELITAKSIGRKERDEYLQELEELKLLFRNGCLYDENPNENLGNLSSSFLQWRNRSGGLVKKVFRDMLGNFRGKEKRADIPSRSEPRPKDSRKVKTSPNRKTTSQLSPPRYAPMSSRRSYCLPSADDKFIGR